MATKKYENENELCLKMIFLCLVSYSYATSRRKHVLLLLLPLCYCCWCYCMLNKLYLIIIIRNSGNKSCVCMCVCVYCMGAVLKWRNTGRTRIGNISSIVTNFYVIQATQTSSMICAYNIIFSIKRNLCLLQNSSSSYNNKKNQIKFNEIFMFRNVSTIFFCYVFIA